MTFKELGLSEDILKVLDQMGFETPTEIQERAIPMLVETDIDMIGIAQTGTGKTAAFGLPLLEKMDASKHCTQGLILAPTRELGKQIAAQLALFSKFMDKINVLPVYGGAPIYDQIRALKKTQHIIIATPGRLIDLIKRKAVKLEELKVLVLDEADEMLDMGFKEELDKILSYTPENKSTWLFSATMAGPIKKIVTKYMNNPIEVKINPKDTVNVNIKHRYVYVRPSNKTEALSRFLDVFPTMRGVVFCRTRRDTQDVAEVLLRKKYKADALHGDLSQNQRDRVMDRFRNHELQVLIATDVAARGIDVNDITHVFHHTIPDDAQYYTHRSGRTARAGKKGVSVAFVGGRDLGKIRGFERSLNIDFKQIPIPTSSEIIKIRMENWGKTVLKQNVNSAVKAPLLEKVNALLAGLSKEELIAKLLSEEYEKLKVAGKEDINEAPGSERDRGRGGGGRRGNYNRRSNHRGSGGGGGGRRRDGRSSDRRDDKPRSEGSGGSRNFSKRRKIKR